MKVPSFTKEQHIASLRAKVPLNTGLSLESVIRQLIEAGFSLPCNGDQVSLFIYEKAENGLKISTLRNYCAMIIKWHQMSGYDEIVVDIASKVPPMIKGLRQTRIEEGRRESRESATPLLLEDAIKIDAYLVNKLSNATGNLLAMASQDLALFRLLWWSGCRESEITSLNRWQVTFCEEPRGIELSWSKTKTDQEGTGSSRFIPALPNADPFGAMFDWIDLYWPKNAGDSPDMTPIFLRQKRNGDWREKHMHPNSIPTWLRRITKLAGVPYADKLSGHSCRHGLATMMSNTVNLREVMDYFKWKRLETALGYLTNKGVSQNVIHALSSASCSYDSIVKPLAISK